MSARVDLVEGVRGDYGLGQALAAAGWPGYYHQKEILSYAARYAGLRAPLERIARNHPDYGYRRTTAELREAVGVTVNQKVVRRLHQLWELPLLRRTHAPWPSGVRRVITEAGGRANLVSALGDIGIMEVLYTDFTELHYADGKAWLMAMLDHCSKVVAGWALGSQADTDLALAAWRRTRRWLRRHEFPVASLIVHHDRDSVYTSYGWTGQLLLRDGVRLSYALNGCRDNPEMESFHSRFKTENRSLFLDAPTVADLRRIVTQRMAYYNRRRRHSSLGNQSSLNYLSRLTPKG